MIKAIKNNLILTKLATAFAVAVLCVFFLFGGAANARAAALSDVQTAYEAQNVWDDLQGAEIDGDKLDLKLYNFDETKNTQVLSFVEFGYSSEDKQSDYGLYVYVYNPRGHNFTARLSLNKIQFRTGSLAQFKKYSLKYLNRSTQEGYEGLFYKFKVQMTDTQRAAVLGALDSSARVYEVSGIELYIPGTGTSATEFAISNTYTYTGFAEGYGGASSLSCTSDNQMSLTLDVRPTYYSPENGLGEYQVNRNRLHSVYFSIPNNVLEKYGGLSAVHATWLNAITDYALVTGNLPAYEATKQYIGMHASEFSSWRDIGELANQLNFNERWCGGKLTFPDYHDPYTELDYGFSAKFANSNSDVADGYETVTFNWAINGVLPTGLTVVGQQEIPQLDYIFYAGGGIDAADEHTVSSEEITEWIKTYTAEHGGELVLDKYSRELFAQVDEEFTEVNVKADDSFTLTQEYLTQAWWEKLFCWSHVNYTDYERVQAIQAVSKDDFKDTPSATCKNLYINEADYTSFKKYYNAATAKDETVFLFRYQVANYWSVEVTELNYITGNTDTNAYLFQETVNLDFDIIDVTCSAGDVETVIACISSPQDIIHNATPPLITTSDEKGFWKFALASSAVVIVVLVATRLIKKFSPRWKR